MSGGENVASREVEEVLHAHPAVRDVAVIGLPDPRWGEVVTAVVVTRAPVDCRRADRPLPKPSGGLQVAEVRRVRRRAAPQRLRQGPQARAARELHPRRRGLSRADRHRRRSAPRSPPTASSACAPRSTRTCSRRWPTPVEHALRIRASTAEPVGVRAVAHRAVRGAASTTGASSDEFACVRVPTASSRASSRRLLDSTALWLYEDSVLVKEPGDRRATRLAPGPRLLPRRRRPARTTWCPLDPVDAGDGRGPLRPRLAPMGRDLPAEPVRQPTMPIPGTEGELVPDVDALAAAGEVRDRSRSRTEPGDVVVHHARTLHAAGGNRSATTRRRAISVRYCGDDARVLAPARRAAEAAPAALDRRHAVRRSRPEHAPGLATGRGRRVEPVLHLRAMTMYERTRSSTPTTTTTRRSTRSPATSTRGSGRAACSGRHRRPQVPGGRRPGEPGGEQPDVRPDRQGRRDARLLPRQPGRSQPARVPRRPRADPPRVPRPRRAHRASSTSRDSRACWMFPTLGMLYEELLLHDVEARRPHVHRVQPLARRGLGLRLPGPDLRRALPHARRPGLGDPRARVGDRPRRAHDRDAPGGAVHAATVRARPATPSSIRSGRA